MARLIAAHDWTTSPLGPVESWPRLLRDAVRLILPARAQINLFWGPENVAIYNDAYAPALGQAHPRALGRPAIEGWAGLWEDVGPLLRKVRERGETVFGKARRFVAERDWGREELFYDVSLSPVFGEAGEVAGILCVVSDQTEPVLARQREIAEQDLLAQMFDQAPSFIALLREPGHVFQLTNAACQQLIGERQVIGKTLRAAVPELGAQGFSDVLDKVYATGKPFTGKGARILLRSQPGRPPQERILDFLVQPIKDKDGRVTAIFIEGVDVTAHTRAQARLVVSEESLRLATEAAEIGTWDLDLMTDALTWSARTRAMFGASPDEPITLDDFYACIHPEDREVNRKAFARALDPHQRGVYDVEFRTIGRNDGKLRWVAAKGKGIFDAAGRCVRALGTSIDITARKSADERIRLLAREVDHRANNLMAVVQSTVSLSRAADATSLKSVIGGRIQAIARAHQLLSESRWAGADLWRLANEELLPFTLGDAVRVAIAGPPVALTPAAAQSIAMALHELTTNAAKYGALSEPGGRIELRWRIAVGDRLLIRWSETGGPPVSPPNRRGLGAAILERALHGALKGETRLDWRSEGLICELDLPLASVSEQATRRAHPWEPSARPTSTGIDGQA